MPDLRMPDVNRTQLAARLCRDPELRRLPSGMALCKLSLAQSRKYKTKDGEQKEETLFINATCWGKTAEYVGDHFKKGRPVLVEGRLKLDEWDDKTTGQKRSAVEITAERVQALDWDERREGAVTPAHASAGARSGRGMEEPVDGEAGEQDDIPF